MFHSVLGVFWAIETDQIESAGLLLVFLLDDAATENDIAFQFLLCTLNTQLQLVQCLSYVLHFKHRSTALLSPRFHIWTNIHTVSIPALRGVSLSEIYGKRVPIFFDAADNRGI